MAEEGRVPVFELHIRPMFRLLDREHMAKWVNSFDLWDLTAVWEHRTRILAKVRDSQDMPGTRYGGPWPPEWTRTFERWMSTGSENEPGHHLVLGTPLGDYGIQSVGGDKRRLTVNVAAPTAHCRAWFELESVEPGQRIYTLYLEPAYPKEDPDPTTINTLEGFIKGDATRLVIYDGNGRHEIALA